MNKLIIITICFLLSFILAIGVIWPRYQDFRASQEEVQNLKTRLQLREEHLERLRSITENLKKYKESLSKIDFALPDDPMLLDLSVWMEKEIIRIGLTLERIDFKVAVPAENIPNLQETKILLKIVGSYEPFQYFLSILEDSARLIKIEHISFSSPGEEDLFIFDLTIKTYNYLWQ